MSTEVHQDPVVPCLQTSFSIPLPEPELESAWFDAPRPSSRPSRPATIRPAAPTPIDDPMADNWFR